MPEFRYEAIDQSGRKRRGTLPGKNLSEAATSLKVQGLLITGLNEYAPDTVHLRSSSRTPVSRRLLRVKQSETILMLKQLAALLRSGVTMVNAFSILETQSRNKRLKQVLAAVRRDVETGNLLSDAMINFPKTFPLMVTNIVRTGEASGLLDDALERIALYWEEKLALRQQILTSMIYPSIVLLVAIAVVVFILSYVLPNMLPFLETMGGELPWSTQFLINVSEMLLTHWDMILLSFAAFFLVLAVAYAIPAGRMIIDRLKMRIPVIGQILQYSLIVFFAKTLAILIGSGVFIEQALKATRETMGNRAARKILERMAMRVTYGETLSAPLLESGSLFPPMVGNMIKVGEETGSIDSSLYMVADIYSKLLESKIKKMIAMIEPALLVFLGGIVAFIAASLVSAILSSYNTF
jgi:type IV pilus assembly protein PilC